MEQHLMVSKSILAVAEQMHFVSSGTAGNALL
jgi:hypothetical protein